MAHPLGSLLFTPAVKALQERHGSRRQYGRLESREGQSDTLGPDESEFIAARDSFYLATVGSGGWPYVQHRGGPKGFLKVLDARTIAFADYAGNKQFISAGNLLTDGRAALIMVDYPAQVRLKILGHVQVLEGEAAKDWLPRVADADYRARVERVFVIRVEAFDWNCRQHITPRYTAEEIQEAIAPLEERVRQLEQENEKLRSEQARGRT